jgi:hypothetical protein
MNTDYTDPSTIDVAVVCGNINHDFKRRGHHWDNSLSWPNVTVKALADEIERLNQMTERCGICGERGKTIEMYGPHPERSQRNEWGGSGDFSPVPWCKDCTNQRTA